jgi:hypothetical protein
MINGTSLRNPLALFQFAERADQPVRFDERGKAELAVGIQQFDLPDLAQIQTHGVFGKFSRIMRMQGQEFFKVIFLLCQQGFIWLDEIIHRYLQRRIFLPSTRDSRTAFTENGCRGFGLEFPFLFQPLAFLLAWFFF